jgi:heat shock protein HslJ
MGGTMNNKTLVLGLLSLTLVLSACTLPWAATPTPTPPQEDKVKEMPTKIPTPVVPTPTPTLPLEEQISNVRWQWVELHESDVQSKVSSPETYWLLFEPDGSFEVRTDCNQSRGVYTLEGATLNLGLTRPRDTCGPASLQNLFVQWLTSVDRAELENNRLVLHAPSGANKLVFDRQPDMERKTMPSVDAKQVRFDDLPRFESTIRMPDIAYSFSPDTEVVTVMFNDLVLDLSMPEDPLVATWHVPLVFPLQSDIDLRIELCILGAMYLEPTTHAILSVHHAGKTWNPEIPTPVGWGDHVDIAVCDETWLPAGMDYDLNLVLSVQRDPLWPDAQATVWIDVLEVEALPLYTEQ